MKPETLKVGPFTWTRDDQAECECWHLVIPKNVGLSFFCVKNYGGKPNDSSAFSGWRVVGGGPFTRAGGWTSRQAAMRGAVPFLLGFYRDQIAEKVAEAQRARKAMLEWSKEIGA